MVKISFFMIVVLAVCFPGLSVAGLSTLDHRIVADSTTDYTRRIYSYDMKVDVKGNVHIIYLEPVAGTEHKGRVVYLSRVSGIWLDPVVLTSDGMFPADSVNMIIGSDDVVHVCYVEHQEDGVGGAFDPAHDRYLAYQKIVNGVPGQRQVVSPGGWHSAMQLDNQGRAFFLRQDEDWQASNEPKFAIFSTTDGVSWTRRLLNFPVNERRLQAFIYRNGRYHILYCDNTQVKTVLVGTNSTVTTQGIFYDLHYATSFDGQQWATSVVDDSFTLYKNELWTTMVINGNQPVVGIYKYAEYGNEYNTGTSALFARWDGYSWSKRNLTPADYSATREGMGIGLLPDGSGGYFGSWDFSPDNTYDDNFRGPRGNIALAKINTEGIVTAKYQLAEFSAEGRLKMCKQGNSIFILALGDFVDTKLYFWEIDINALASGGPSPGPLPISGQIKGALPSILFLLK